MSVWDVSRGTEDGREREGEGEVWLKGKGEVRL